MSAIFYIFRYTCMLFRWLFLHISATFDEKGFNEFVLVFRLSSETMTRQAQKHEKTQNPIEFSEKMWK